MASIFTDIEENVNENELLGQIDTQINQLTAADGEVNQFLKDLPEELQGLTGFLNGVTLPEIDLSDQLNRGLTEVTNLIPDDVTSITGSVAEGLDDFFGQLNIDLGSKMSSVLDAFKSIDDLKEIDFSFGASSTDTDNDSPPPAEARFVGRGMSSIARNVQNRNGQLQNNLAGLSAFLEQLSETLSVENLLQWILEGLQQFPRQRLPIRYFPIVDELVDKLSTVLAWKDMDEEALSLHLSTSISQLRLFLEQVFYEKGVNAMANGLEDVMAELDKDGLKTSTQNLINHLNNLSQNINNENLLATTSDIANLNQEADKLELVLAHINAHFLTERLEQVRNDLFYLEDKMQGQMFLFLGTLHPPEDLSILSLAIEPANELFDQIGFTSLTEKITEIRLDFQALLNRFNLAGVKDELQDIINGAGGAVDEIKNLLLSVTVELSLVMNEIESRITELELEKITEFMQKGLTDFSDLIEEGVNQIFEPIRAILNDVLDTINGFLEDFNPAVLVEKLVELIQKLTDILGHPKFVKAIERVQEALDTVNQELADFEFKPVTNTVIDAIEAVGKALEVVAKIPLTDSLKDDLKNAINKIPTTPELQSAVDAINETLNDIVTKEDGPRAILTNIRDKPAELISIVEGYSPDKYIGENVSKPYQEFLTKMESFGPAELIAPIQLELNKVKEEVQNTIDPEKLMEPLEEPFNDLISLIDNFDPNKIIQPIQEKLTEGIKTITDNLPLEATDEIFEAINNVVEKIEKGVQTGTALRDLLLAFQVRLGGLENAEEQVRTFAESIVEKLDTLESFNPISTAFEDLEIALDRTQAAPLQAAIHQPLELAISSLSDLNPKPFLLELVSAHSSFPMSKLEALSDSPEKAAILAFFERFDPMNIAISRPFNQLDTWLSDLNTIHEQSGQFFSTWDSTYHQDNSPFNDLRLVDTTIDNLKELLKNNVEQQLTNTLAPLFRIVDHFQNLFDTLLTELAALISDLEIRVLDFLSLSDDLEELRASIFSLVTALEAFDISFMADRIEEIFDVLSTKLETFRPSAIAQQVNITLEEVLNLLNLKELLGTAALDDKYNQAIQTLRENDPDKLLTEQIQPEYDKILVFLKQFDISEPMETFIGHIESLQEQLTEELNKIVESYGEMRDAVPT